MKTFRLLQVFLKKKIRTAKLRSLIIGLIFTILYVFLFIILSSTFTIKKTASKTFKSNLSNQNISMIYNGFSNIDKSYYLELKNHFEELDKNIFSIYSKTKYFELYDYDYLNINTDIKLNISEYTDCVILSNDFMEEYSVGDYYEIDDLTFKVLGFFEGENSVIADLNYVLSLKKYDIRIVSFTARYDNLSNDDIKNMISTYDEMKNMVGDNDSFTSSELDTIKDVNKITNIYTALALVLIVVATLYSVIAILNVFNVNKKIDSTYYAIMRLNGLTKTKIKVYNVLENILLNFLSLLLSIVIFYSVYSLTKEFLSKLVYTMFELFIDGFSFDIDMDYYNNIIIFVIPWILNIIIILLKSILSRNKKDYIHFEGLDEYAR